MLLYTDPTDVFKFYGFDVGLFSVFSLVYSLLLYTFNKATSDPSATAKYLAEVKAVIMNVILFVFIVLTWKGLNGLSATLTGTDLIGYAEDGIDSLIYYPRLVYLKLAEVAPEIAMFSGVSGSGSLSFWFFKAGAGFSTNALSSTFSKVASLMNSAFSYVFHLSVLKSLLSVLEFYSVMFFLPIGVILRAFSYTRRLGSTMVSMAVGAGLMLPVVIGLTSSIAYEIIGSPEFLNVDGYLVIMDERLSELNADLENYADKYLNASKFLYISALNQLVLKGLDLLGFTPIVGQLATLTFSAVIMGLKGWMAYLIGYLARLHDSYFSSVVAPNDFFLYAAKSLIAISIGIALFYFVVALTLIAFIRAFSSLLGGEFFLYGVEGLI